uniref:Uncharacterized protein n=1 Tax=Tetraselmis sp. GSL018 TaxID=582737 RepID=A0A061S7V5_9CHLO|eukprot:CAMPEP_0177600350 /NCGR_PEP_ID=MMETSP0419_2-20121207/13572_1 /TAXON_ID=582737 /ORGANISM="Tetraselmis sp., Strain GSL018" /LENGTH=132 /DNA_ID=CAMNT_0019093329 /DNA_START=161 /DNA_END=559 /DNA_ORIENTATION=-
MAQRASPASTLTTSVRPASLFIRAGTNGSGPHGAESFSPESMDLGRPPGALQSTIMHGTERSLQSSLTSSCPRRRRRHTLSDSGVSPRGGGGGGSFEEELARARWQSGADASLGKGERATAILATPPLPPQA